MKNAINTLRIQNFKSIKDVAMQPRRVNLIIGQPNVGKSNILEAMSLLGAGLYERGAKFMDTTVRYETTSNLFYDNDTSQPILVNSSNGLAILQTQSVDGTSYHFISTSNQIISSYKQIIQSSNLRYGYGYNVENAELKDLLRMKESQEADIKEAIDAVYRNYTQKKAYFSSYRIQEDGGSSQLGTSYAPSDELPRTYKYHPKQNHNSVAGGFLEPPLGRNLSNVIQRNPELRKEIAALFKPYGLSLVLRVAERKFEIQKQVDDLIYNYPYSSIADTLQRIIFYLAAIESNNDAVILLEEPEAHSYPLYVSMLGRRMVESRSNQFFVATHSPYLITEILEQMLPDEEQASELAIFVAYYEDYQTKVKQLSDEDVRAIRADGLDVFYNMDRFIPSAYND
ncbi:AAA family ATPase [Hymenobacter armeniacus]|uniref:AAA family ATPase n=1 Tax=Hymenobacter armeniacus TaxID=2771358 RepID=A0ABR8JTB7_9BACT|nr:AAA family ATPase [Hymenobacter armeniacus]MBD2723210.1 AAA family ATPase [Hymenobacter armeniacus]